MGEGKRDRSTKRQRPTLGIGKSSSDSELARGKVKVKDRWPLVEGLTVDELAHYRRRRVQGHPKDSLGVRGAENVIENLISEYRRAFHVSSDDLFKENIWPIKSSRPRDHLRSKGPLDKVASYHEEFKEYDQVDASIRRKGPSSNLFVANDDKAMETETESSRFIAHSNPAGRPALTRRDTSLKYEGDFHADTEYSCYVPHEGRHRPELARRPTSLKMEGDMDTMTEKCEKFIEWLNVSRPELIRIPTNLKIEGDFETLTENHDKYVPFVGVRRPELLRQSTNLRMEGEFKYVPEYTDVFKEYDVRERQLSKKPETHLKMEGDFYQTTETTEMFVNPKMREMQLMAELERDVAEEENMMEEEEEEEEEKRQENEDEIKILMTKLEDLKGPPLEIPEYRDAYKEFPRERPKLMRPEDEIGKADGSKIPSSPTLSKFRTKIDMDPEYKSRFLDLSKDRPLYRKPPIALRPTMISGRTSVGIGRTGHQEPRRSDIEPTSEVRSQYVPYGQVPRVETVKMPANIRLEGNIDLQPEYRNAYCTKRDWPTSNEPRMHRGRVRSLSASRRKDNHWLNNNANVQFGWGNAGQNPNAFQILNTETHEESIVRKPPSGSRRASRSSQIQMQALQDSTQPGDADRSTLRNRSPSPTYRLHVCNVDNEPRGFGRRERSPSVQVSGRTRSPSPDRPIPSNSQRPYSPSFGRDSRQNMNGKSFVVLDDIVVDNSKINYNNEARRRRIDRNCNVDSQNPMPRGRPRTRTMPNWMPPWYDNVNTI